MAISFVLGISPPLVESIQMHAREVLWPTLANVSEAVG